MPVILSSGVLATLEQTGDLTSDSGIVWLGEGLATSTSATIYREVPAVRSVVDFLAKNLALVPLRVYRKSPTKGPIHMEDSPLQRLLDRPEPRVARTTTMRALWEDYLIEDTCFAIHERVGGSSILTRIPPRFVSISEGTYFAPKVFKVSTGSAEFDVPVDSSFWVHGFNVGSNTAGTSPMQTLKNIIGEQIASQKHRTKVWQNGPRIGGIVRFPVDSPINTKKDARERFSEGWNNKYTGPNATQGGGTPILYDGGEYQRVDYSADEMKVIEYAHLSMETVLHAYGVPPAIFGLGGTQTYASVSAYQEALFTQVLASHFTLFKESFEVQTMPDYVDEKTHYLEFNTKEFLRMNFAEQAEAYQKAGGGPWLLIDEIREFEELGPLPDDEGAHLVVPSNTIRAGGPQANPTDVKNQENMPMNPQKAAEAPIFDRFLARMEESVRNDKATRNGDFSVNRSRWTRELARDLALIDYEFDAAAFINGLADEVETSYGDIPAAFQTARSIYV